MVLRKLKPSKRVLKYGYDFSEDFFVFDTETWGLEPTPEKFAFGVVYGKVAGEQYTKVLHTVYEAREEFKKTIYYKKTIFAHNCEYDLMATFGNVFQTVDNEALFVGSTFICAYLDKINKVRFADSVNLLKTSVEKVGLALGYKKGVTPDKFISGQVETVEQSDIDYCVRDCEIVYKALNRFFLKIGAVKLTIASSAMHYFRLHYQEENIYFDRDKSNEFFDSYFGGRTEAFKLGNCSGQVVDINSLYPFIMSTIEFPHPNYLKTVYRPSVDRFTKFLLKHFEGCVDCEVEHGNHYFGHLPYKSEIAKQKKLLFPVGEFRGTFNFNELRYAIESGVLTIKKVHKVVYSTRTMESPFKAYILDNYDDRKHTTNDFDNYVIKLLMNALYGKFAERVREKKVYFEDTRKAIDFINAQKQPEMYRISLFSKDRKDCFVHESLEIAIQPKHSIPVFSSYITSAARIMLLDQMKKTDSILYCDTDSIFYSGNINTTISDELGDWKLEDKKVVQIRGLKNYTYKNSKGELIEMIKGVGKRATKIGDGHYIEQKYHKSKGALRRSVQAGTKNNVEKILTGIYDKRIILENGDTLPIKL